MAGPLAAMERFFERIFERPAARLLAPRLEPVHLQRHLERAMESGRARRDGKWQVPSRYRVLLHSADLVALSGREALPAELAEGLRDHARRRGYVLDARPSVKLEASPRISPGDAAVLADDHVVPAMPPPSSARASDGATAMRPRSGETIDAAGAAGAAGGAGSAGADDLPAVGSTSTFRAAQPQVPKATIAARAPGQPMVRIALDGAKLRIGRSADNDIVLADQRVSRHHGEISVRLGTLIYTDLGSTNGSFMQGSRIHEIALGPDDVIQLGGSSLTIEPAGR